ncbi:Na+/H+ antiporter subunit E [Azospirillum ramasamyi]|uniref:Na+/H+ antiporter subunit E n=1 Tax=Azospirillum ramasamyi TaxID=682998 RepID=A0A2U9SFX7_9PROT|nr:Na+/H+ antiporter subunit E [Azospirillum ramasamyi]AWU96688.1 Na+/H+ antiporter subunit E [Azospirillum ramasamyi]
MSKWLPYPMMTATLLGVWLLLNESVAPGTIILGAVLSVATAATLKTLDLPAGRFRRPWAAVSLLGLVLEDIVRSNIAVAWIILRPGKGGRVSGFVRIPLELRAPYGLATLACIVTATPGTVWVAYDRRRNTILLHILDLVDEQVWIDTIKGRYETRLMELFE